MDRSEQVEALLRTTPTTQSLQKIAQILPGPIEEHIEKEDL